MMHMTTGLTWDSGVVGIMTYHSSCCTTTMQTHSCSHSSSPPHCLPPSVPPGLSDDGHSASSRAYWTVREETVLINFLVNYPDKPNGAMFKDKVFQEVALAIQGLHVKGTVKSMSSCKTKFKNICISSFVCLICILTGMTS